MKNSAEHRHERRPAERAAWAVLLYMTPRKRHFVRVFEGLLHLFLPLLPSPLEAGQPGADPSRILVIEYWNLGDLAILVPFLKNLRQNYPGARISLLFKEGLSSFLEGQGLVDEFIPVRVPWAQHFSRLRKYNPFSKNWISLFLTLLRLRKIQFDWAFSGRMDIRDNVLLWFSGARRRIGYGLGGGGFLLTDRVLPDLSRPHRVDVWLHLLNGIGGTVVRETASFRLSEADIASGQDFLSRCGIPSGSFVIGIHPGARIAVRRWGNDNFAEVAHNLRKQTDTHFLWFSDPGDPSPAPPIDRCHTVSIGFRPFLAVLAKCHLLICNDSGPMHFANLLGIPVVAVFGPTNPIWFGPRGSDDLVVIRPEFWCRPCFDECIFDQPYCLRTIEPKEVIQAAAAVIEETRGNGSAAVDTVDT